MAENGTRAYPRSLVWTVAGAAVLGVGSLALRYVLETPERANSAISQRHQADVEAIRREHDLSIAELRRIIRRLEAAIGQGQLPVAQQRLSELERRIGALERDMSEHLRGVE